MRLSLRRCHMKGRERPTDGTPAVEFQTDDDEGRIGFGGRTVGLL